MSVTNKDEIIEILKNNSSVLRDLGVEKIGLFGSYIRNEQLQDSDVDLLVEFISGRKSFRNLMALADYTEKTLGKKVDIVTLESLSPYIAPHINKEVFYVQIAN